MLSKPKTTWPSLPLNEWQETHDLLHLLTQIIGKIKLKLTPLINHWWNVALHPSSSGLSTGLIHYPKGCFQVELDFIHHKILIKVEDGKTETIDLKTTS